MDFAQIHDATRDLQSAALEQARLVRQALAMQSPWGAREPSESEVRTAFDDARQALSEQRYQDAVRGFTVLSAVRPRQAPVFFGLGLSLQMLRHTSAAQQAYGAAYLLDPLRADSLFRLGECALDQGDHAQAREMWLKALKLCDEFPSEPGLRELVTAALDRLQG